MFPRQLIEQSEARRVGLEREQVPTGRDLIIYANYCVSS